jgi:hypothetical protein
MGNKASVANSAVTLNNNTLVVNKSSLDYLNQLTASTTANQIIKILSNCTGSMTNINTIDFGGTLNISSGSNVTINQNIKSSVNFKCLQQSEVQTQLTSNMSNTIQQALQNNLSTDILNKMDAQAQSASQSAFLSLSGSKSNSEVNANSDTKIINQTDRSLKNIINVAVTSNFTQETVNSCVSQMLNKQIASFQKGANVSENSTLIINQDISSSQIAECIQNGSFASDITNALTQFYQIDVKDDAKNTSETEMKGTAESESKASGFFEDVGQMFKGIGEGLGGLVGLGAIGPMATFSSSSCVILCCCIMIILVIVFAFKNSDETSQFINSDNNLLNKFSYKK